MNVLKYTFTYMVQLIMNVRWRYVADIFMDVSVKFSYSDLYVSFQHSLVDLKKGTCVLVLYAIQ